MSCERVMLTDCSFEDHNTTYISSWRKQKSPKDCEYDCQITTIPKCHFWMQHMAKAKCDLYERDKRTCRGVGGPVSLTGLYCTGTRQNTFLSSYFFVLLRILSFEQTLHFPLFLILQIKMRMMAVGLNGVPLESVLFREEGAKEHDTGIVIRPKHLKEDYRV